MDLVAEASRTQAPAFHTLGRHTLEGRSPEDRIRVLELARRLEVGRILDIRGWDRTRLVAFGAASFPDMLLPV